MADVLEDDSFDEKQMDRLIFKNGQLLVFKHDFREASMIADDEAHKQAFAHGVKSVSDLSRKLGRLKGTLSQLTSRSVNNNERRFELIKFESMTESIIDRTSNLHLETIDDECLSDRSEFDMKFASKLLPDFDNCDMDLFLGKEMSNCDDSHRSYISHVDKLRHDWTNKFEKLQKECEKLFEDCSFVIHSFGICDEFLYT